MTGKVVFTKKNDKGLFGFIECKDGTSHYFDTSGIVKGKFIKPDAEVEFDVAPSRGGKTQAINVQLVKKAEGYSALESEKAIKLLEILRSEFSDREFIDWANLPAVFMRAGINYREHAENLKSFVETYLPTYSVIKKFIFENKEYPMVLVHQNRQCNEITEEIRSAVLTELKKMISKDGFFPAMKLPSILKQFGIKTFRDYSPSMDAFIDTNFNGLFVSKFKVQIGGKVYPKIYVPAENANQFHENVTSSCAEVLPVADPDGEMSLESAVVAIDAFLQNELSKYSYVLSAYFPNIAKKCGLSDFRNYADSVEQFLEKYLPRYELKKNVPIQGKVYPGIIVLRGTMVDESDNVGEPAPINGEIVSKVSFSLLDEHFESGRYAEFLSSDILKRLQPYELPLEYMEKALTCAQRLLFPESTETISLNGFQQELIRVPTTSMFIKKWKINGIFNETMVQQCADTAIAHFDYPEHSALVVKLLNAIGTEKNLNNNYVGITERFVACENVLIPHFYILRAFVQNSQKSTQNIVSEYCQIIRDIKHSPSGPIMTKDQRMCAFENVLSVIHNHVLDFSQLARTARTNAASVFVENDKMQALRGIVPLWDKERSSPEWKIVDLYFNLDLWTEQRFAQLIDDGVNRQMLQQCLALRWRESCHDGVLDENLLDVLSWVILYDDATSIDEIIRYSSGKESNKNMLINSFDRICDRAVENSKMYLLASYIAFSAQEYASKDSADAQMAAISEKWNKFSADFYAEKMQQMEPVTSETEDRLADLFFIFRNDFQHYLKLQSLYAEWFVRSYPPKTLSAEDVDAALERLYNKEAYAAFAEFYSLDLRTETDEIRKKYTSQYIESLINLHRFGDAISFLWNAQTIDAAEKNKMLIRAIGENFRINGLSSKAFSYIGTEAMRNEAVRMLLAEFKTTQPYIINSLVALYLYEKKYIHAAYLLTVFGSKLGKGFARLYSQIHSQLWKYVDFNKLKSQHHVIATAFQTLKPTDLIEFLNWTRKITIPNFKEHREAHVFSFYYDNIAADTTNIGAWVMFLNHLVKNGLERNAADICVCETVLHKVLNYTDSNYSQSALDYILSSANPAQYPPNFLVYAFEIIEASQSASLCQRLADALLNESLYQHVIIENVWINVYKEDIQTFKSFCQHMYGSNGDPAFREILSRLGTEMSVLELKNLAQSAASRQALFSKICNNYLNDCDEQGTKEVLFSEDWPDMTEVEHALLNILRLVYTDDDVLMLENEDLLDDEFTVWRFKRDCAEIVSTYPEKTGLFAFDKVCNNEAYKMLVYSYVFEAFYDQDIYSSFDKLYTDFTDPQAYKTYLRLLHCAYQTQSRQNSTFPLFYLRWRYLKLYLGLILKDRTSVNDAEIITLMEKNGHYNEVYADTYVPFVETVNQFMALDGVPQEFKTHFLFSAMVGHAEDLFDCHAQTLSDMPAHHKMICRKLVAFLDFRNFDFCLYTYLREDIRDGNFQAALPLAEAISEYAVDALTALKDSFTPAAISVFELVAFAEKASQAVNSIVAMEIDEISEHHQWLIPLMCSRQFDFLINNRFRSLVITQRDSLVCRKYEFISGYLVSKGRSLGVHTHLSALLACIKKDAESAKKLIADNDFCRLVPQDWSDEAERITEYANGLIPKFKPDKVQSDGSRGNADKDAEFAFPTELLRSVFNEDGIPDSTHAAEELYTGCYKESDPWTQAKMGLEVLLWRAKHPNSQAKTIIPPAKDLALDVGLALLSPEVGLSVENRLLITAELYNNCSVFSGKQYSDKIEKLKLTFAKMIDTGFPLALWIKYRTNIEAFLRETNTLIDFDKIKTRILDQCADIASPDKGIDEKHGEYSVLLNSFSGLTSSYSVSVMRAIKDEIDRLANGIRLSVEIENRETSDFCVYFRIKNTGHETVSFSNGLFEVELQQQDQPAVSVRITNIPDLQNGSSTGGVAHLIETPEQSIFVKLLVRYTDPDGTVEIICSAEENMQIIAPCPPEVPILAVKTAQNSVSRAVTDDSLLFGRDDKKKALELSIPSGVTLIYGPSRIGKTSLMNWIRKEHAASKGNVLSVLIGGEDGYGKDRDYKKNITDPTGKSEVPYDDASRMSQYLLVDTLMYGLTDRIRLHRPQNVPLPDDLISNMLGILGDETKSISDKYWAINDKLQETSIELWLLLDEFQQVVERWENPPGWCEFFEICDLLSNPDPDSKPNHIKLIFCGSDDLLTHMILKKDSVWKKAFRSTVPVGALDEEYFEKMIKGDKAISLTNLSFSPLAIETLFNYTGGIALYGKEICRAIFEEISENPPKWANRSVIYTSDIAETTQTLLKTQDHDISIQAQEGISTIYAAVTKHLDLYTEQLLWYMAKWLYEHPLQDGFPENHFSGETLTPGFEESFYDSFRIAEARGIIKKETLPYNKKTVYKFNTLFYYFAFYGSAADNLRRELIIAPTESAMETGEVVRDPLTEIKKSFSQLRESEQTDTMMMLYGRLAENQVPKFRKRLGDYSETNIGTQNNVSVSIQSMSNAFATLLSSDVSSAQYLEAFRKLPSVQMFIPEESRKLLGERITTLQAAEDDESARAAECDVEEITSRAEQEMTGTYIAAAMNSADFFKISDEQWETLIHISKAELELHLPPEFITSLGFAVMLHNVFESIQRKASSDDAAREKADAELDYCPVAIMYCKVVEALLKELHTPVYARQLGDRSLSGASKTVFGDLLREDGTVVTDNKDLTIGSFSYHIVKPGNHDDDNNIDHPDKFLYIPKMGLIQRITKESSKDEAINQEWSEHAVKLSVVQGVRNKSAHEARPITRANFDWLIQTLFDERELLRIAELATKQYPSN